MLLRNAEVIHQGFLLPSLFSSHVSQMPSPDISCFICVSNERKSLLGKDKHSISTTIPFRAPCSIRLAPASFPIPVITVGVVGREWEGIWKGNFEKWSFNHFK